MMMADEASFSGTSNHSTGHSDEEAIMDSNASTVSGLVKGLWLN